MATEKAVEYAADGALIEHVGEESHGSGIHIALAAEELGTAAGIPITNTLVMSLIVFAMLAAVAVRYGRKISLIPGRVQALLELLVEGAYDYMTTTLESRDLARKYFPLIMTIFLFIAAANVVHFVPGIGSLTFDNSHGETVPLLRSVNTDLNATLALTIIAVIAIEVAGVAALGFFAYAGKFINFSSPLNFIVGLIELVSEVSRLVSFSFRLFGNIFAGEVLIGVVGFFVPYLLPVPLMAFETFVGILQGIVFAMLVLFFIKLAIMMPHGEHKEAH